jgi:hypothetical protein
VAVEQMMGQLAAQDDCRWRLFLNEYSEAEPIGAQYWLDLGACRDQTEEKGRPGLRRDGQKVEGGTAHLLESSVNLVFNSAGSGFQAAACLPSTHATHERNSTMIGLAVGDLLCPTDKMATIFSVEGLREKISKVWTVDFTNTDRADIRRTWRNVEENGPAAEPAPEKLLELIAEAELLAIPSTDQCRTLRAARQKAIATAREAETSTGGDRSGIPVINTPNHNSQAVRSSAIRRCWPSAQHQPLISHEVLRGYYPNTGHPPAAPVDVRS